MTGPGPLMGTIHELGSFLRRETAAAGEVALPRALAAPPNGAPPGA